MIAFICFFAGLLIGGCVTLTAIIMSKSYQQEREIMKLKEKLNMD